MEFRIPTLFVWRGKEVLFRRSNFGTDTKEFYQCRLYQCPYCEIDLIFMKDYSYSSYIHKADLGCPICGFTHHYEFEFDTSSTEYYEYAEMSVSILRELSINDAELGMDELGTHLQRNYKDIFSLEPRKFECLVADVYKNIGYTVRVTPRTRDGGYDIVLLENQCGDQIIVECKRYSAHRKVGVGIVREIVGVQILRNKRKAKIVTTSNFTQDSVKAALLAKDRGIELELVDAEELLRCLGVYNTTLPPMHQFIRNNPKKNYTKGPAIS